MPPSTNHPPTRPLCRTDLLAVILLLAIALAALWPLARYGVPLHTDDIKYHATSAQDFLAEMQAGALYPRWLSGMNGGLGSPFFFFYGPVSFWLTSLAATITGITDPVTLVATVLGAMLCASGLSAYAWLRHLAPPAPATIGAALYLVLPYHLTIDLWSRAALYEFNAFAITPLVFLGIDAIRGRRPWGMALLPPAYAALIMTHIVTAMLVTAVAGLVILIQRPTLRSLAATAFAFALGIALAAAYLAPALGLREATTYQAQDIARIWFLPAPLAGHPAARMMQMLTVLVVLQLLFAAAMLAWGYARRHRPHGRPILLWAAVTALTLLGMFGPLKPVWNRLPVLNNAQFPFRILAITDLAIATLATLAAAQALARTRHPTRAAAAALAALAVFGVTQAAIPIRNGIYATPAWLPEIPAHYDYRWFRPLASIDHLPMDTDPAQSPHTPLIAIPAGNATATLLAHRSRHYSLAIDAPAPATLRLGQLDFPGWRATARGTALPTHPSPDMGLLDIDLPPGRYPLDIDLTRTPIEKLGLAITAAAAVLWAALGGALLIRKRAAHTPSLAQDLR